MDKLTLSEVGKLLASNYYPHDPIEQTVRGVRHLVEAGIIEPTLRETSGRRMAWLGSTGICGVVVATYFQRQGIPGQTVTKLVRLLDNINADQPVGESFTVGFGYVVERVTAGERWQFAYAIDAAGKLTGACAPEGTPPNPIIESTTVYRGVLNLSRLLSPILAPLSALPE